MEPNKPKKSRTIDTTPIGEVAPVVKEGKTNVSSFLITINPNKMFKQGIDNPEAREMKAKLTALSDFLLKKKTIRSCLIFPDKPPKEGQVVLKLTRDEHIAKIVSISDDRSGAVEIGAKDKKLHMHCEFDITHRTFLQLDRNVILQFAATILNLPAKGIHLHISATSKNYMNYKDYVLKGTKEQKNQYVKKEVQTEMLAATQVL